MVDKKIDDLTEQEYDFPAEEEFIEPPIMQRKGPMPFKKFLIGATVAGVVGGIGFKAYQLYLTPSQSAIANTKSKKPNFAISDLLNTPKVASLDEKVAAKSNSNKNIEIVSNVTANLETNSPPPVNFQTESIASNSNEKIQFSLKKDEQDFEDIKDLFKNEKSHQDQNTTLPAPIVSNPANSSASVKVAASPSALVVPAPETKTTVVATPVKTPPPVILPKAAIVEKDPIISKSVESTPLPPQTVTHQVSIETQKLLQNLERLNRQIENNGEQIARLESSINTISRNISKVSNDVNSMDSRIMGLNNNVNALTNDLSNVKRTLSEDGIDILSNSIPPLPENTKNQTNSTLNDAIPPPNKNKQTITYQAPEYQVYAIIPGQAWLKSTKGQILTVSEGDTIGDYGKVLVIDAGNGIVLTSSGVSFR
ncbi:MAG: icmG dotF [Francisellaceae bacterium]|nr:icmG dotF [Francisellaceae bacterium]